MLKTSLIAILLCLLTLLTACDVFAPATQQVDRYDFEPVAAFHEQTGELEYRLDERLPEALRQVVRGNRLEIFREDAEDAEQFFALLTAKEIDVDRDRETAALVNIEPPEEPSRPLSREQVAEELDFLFAYLKYGYAGYEYFGGDAVMLRVKESIQAQADEIGYPLSQLVYRQLLITSLAEVIKDSHFQIGTTYFGMFLTEGYFYLNEELQFRQELDQYLINIDNKEYNLVSIDGLTWADCLRPTLTADGEMAWCLSATSIDREREMILTVQLEGTVDQRELMLEVPLTRTAPTTSREEEAYQLLRENGIPILQIRSLGSDESLERLVQDAKDLREESYLIIDLRRNQGGSLNWCEDWLLSYTGSLAGFRSHRLQIYTQTYYASYGVSKKRWPKIEPQMFPGWLEPNYAFASKVENENLVFVLVDQQTRSAGEFFLKMLQQMENVVVVGTNTAGYVTVGDTREIYLPESKTVLSCGVRLFLEPDLTSAEGGGYAPDLWCPPAEALMRVLQVIENLR